MTSLEDWGLGDLVDISDPAFVRLLLGGVDAGKVCLSGVIVDFFGLPDGDDFLAGLIRCALARLSVGGVFSGVDLSASSFADGSDARASTEDAGDDSRTRESYSVTAEREDAEAAPSAELNIVLGAELSVTELFPKRLMTLACSPIGTLMSLGLGKRSVFFGVEVVCLPFSSSMLRRRDAFSFAKKL